MRRVRDWKRALHLLREAVMTTEARPDLEARRERARKRAHELLGMSRLEHTSPVCTCDRVALELETHEATLSQVRMLLDFERAANGDLIKRATNAEVELEALQRERDEVRDSVGEQFLQWRGVQGKSCKNCGGAGSYSYPDTSTWHRGMGGQSFTMDVCDKCWGSGDSERPWTNLRHLNTKLRRALKWDWKEIARRFARRAFNHRSNYREMVRENAKTRTERDTALADLAAARAKLEPAREAFTRLLAMAQKPMKSWDAGRCVEAERVEEIAAEALEALA